MADNVPDTINLVFLAGAQTGDHAANPRPKFVLDVGPLLGDAGNGSHAVSAANWDVTARKLPTGGVEVQARCHPAPSPHSVEWRAMEDAFREAEDRGRRLAEELTADCERLRVALATVTQRYEELTGQRAPERDALVVTRQQSETPTATAEAEHGATARRPSQDMLPDATEQLPAWMVSRTAEGGGVPQPADVPAGGAALNSLQSDGPDDWEKESIALGAKLQSAEERWRIRQPAPDLEG